MERITATVKNTASHTGEANQPLGGCRHGGQNNGEMMKQVTSKMRLINETSNRISDIIDLIDAIAFQTNILALNAAVESGAPASTAAALRWWRVKFASLPRRVRHLPAKSAS